jgi:hypothetical protein
MTFIRLDDGTQFDVSIPVKSLTQTERAKKAGKSFGLVFMIAVATIIVPVFHFVLVPALSLAAFFVGFNQYKRAFEFDLTGIKCPKCQNDMKEKIVTSKVDSVSVYCFECRQNRTVGLN